MPEKPTDDVEKFLSEQKSLEDRKQAVIEDLLRQRDAAINAFDEKLAKLGYRGKDSLGKATRRSHHKQSPPPADAQAKPQKA